MNKAQLVYRLNCKDTFRDVKPCDIFREGIVFDEHRHKIATGKELHDEVEVGRVLERVIELHDPRRVGLGKYVTLSANVGKLWKK